MTTSWTLLGFGTTWLLLWGALRWAPGLMDRIAGVGGPWKNRSRFDVVPGARLSGSGPVEEGIEIARELYVDGAIGIEQFEDWLGPILLGKIPLAMLELHPGFSQFREPQMERILS